MTTAVALSSNQKTLMNHQEAQDDAFSHSLSLALSLPRPDGGVLGFVVSVPVMTRVRDVWWTAAVRAAANASD